jgi:CubicO group peptidase (beta-lactamase class C family)
MLRTLIAVLFVFSLVLPAVPRVNAAPASDWPTAVPEEYGIDSAKLADALLTMQQEIPDLNSVILIRDGKVLVDAPYYPYDGDTPHDMASVTKSVTTTLIGIAIDQGKLALDDPVLSFFPDRTIANRDARKEAMTVADLASNTSGLACYREPAEPTQAEMSASDNWVQFTLDLPMMAAPGSRWEYCSPGFHLLSAILTVATGQTELDFAWANLFGPLGMRDVIWPSDPQGNTRGMGDLMLRPLDAAKLGQLWLNGGEWQGRQIVSRDWVEAASTAKVATTDENQDYGYGWWMDHENAAGHVYRADGRGGQYIVVVPALDVVLATTGSGSFDAGDVGDRIAQALVDPAAPLPANPAGVARLNEVLAGLAQAPAAQPVPPLPVKASEISGTIFRFAPNPLTIESMRLDFGQPDEARIEIMLKDNPKPILGAIGLDGVYHFLPGDFGFPIGARGAWEDAQAFVIDFNTFANDDAYDLRLHFEGDSVTVEMKDRTRGSTVQLEGKAASK